LRGFVSLVTRNSTKICFVFWWKWTRPYMEIIKMLQTSFWTCSFWVVQESEIIWIGKWLPLILCSHSLIKSWLTNRNSSSTVEWPNRFNIPCPNCLQYQPFMTNLELDGIELILTITSQVISIQIKWVMWYNNKIIYNTTPVGRGSHKYEDNEIYKSCLLKIKWKEICYSMCDGWVWREQCYHLSKAFQTVQRWYLWVWCK
jgi:hypothetical protein